MIPRLTISREQDFLNKTILIQDFINGDKLSIAKRPGNWIKCVFHRKDKTFTDYLYVISNDFEDLKKDSRFHNYLEGIYYSDSNPGWVSELDDV
jgi:hypothetical protein